MDDIERAQRALGLCEAIVARSAGRGGICRNRARWRRVSAVLVDADKRVCGVHARAYLPESLVEVGTDGWEEA